MVKTQFESKRSKRLKRRADAREVAEEVADCQLIQIKIIAGIPEDVMQEVQQAKLEKLKRGLNSSEKPS